MRRRVLLGTALAAGLGMAASPVLGRLTAGESHEVIKVGLLHSLSGTVAIAEKPIADAELLAIEEINSAGGVLGRRIEPIVVDARSDWPTFASGARRLIVEDGVSVIFGCYTSASRRTLAPVIEEHDHLLFYPTFYEGLEQSRNIVYTGGTPNQFVIPAVKWLFDNRGTTFFLVGSDYVYPRSVNAIVRGQLDFLGGTVLGEEYLVLGEQRVAPVIDRILSARPSVIVSTVVGDTNIPFYRALRAAGVTPKRIPSLSLVIGENELRALDAAEMAGDYAALNYFQSVRNDANRRFVDAFRSRFGASQVVSDPMAAAYAGVRLWAMAVANAGSPDPDRVRAAVGGLTMDAPEGLVHVDAENHHLWKTTRIGRIRADGQLDIVWSSETTVHPVPYPPYRTRREWHEMLLGLYESWGGSWAAAPP